MADSPPERRAALVLALLLACAPAVQAAAPRSPASGAEDRTLVIDADSAEVDSRSRQLVLRQVAISQSGMRIEAEVAEASGPEMRFDDSHWEFRGGVRLQLDDGTLRADRATVRFVGNRVARADATGSPAEFEQKLRNSTNLARGRAGNIVYEVDRGLVTLDGSIWFTDSRNEWRSDNRPLVYSLRDQRLQTGDVPAESGQDGGRIHITIRPDDETPADPPP